MCYERLHGKRYSSLQDDFPESWRSMPTIRNLDPSNRNLDLRWGLLFPRLEVARPGIQRP